MAISCWYSIPYRTLPPNIIYLFYFYLVYWFSVHSLLLKILPPSKMWTLLCVYFLHSIHSLALHIYVDWNRLSHHVILIHLGRKQLWVSVFSLLRLWFSPFKPFLLLRFFFLHTTSTASLNSCSAHGMAWNTFKHNICSMFSMLLYPLLLPKD